MDRKARRNKSEQFRKSRNNFFHRGFEICRKSEAEMLVLIKRKGKYYRFLSSEPLLRVPEAEIVAGLAMSKTTQDFVKEQKGEKERKERKKRKRAVTSPATINQVSVTLDSERPTKLQRYYSAQDREGDELPSLATVLEQIKGLGRRK